MTIRLNGEPHELAGPLTVSALLTELGIDSRRVAVEHNQIVVKRAAYETALVQEHDEVEIVNFVGGGSGNGHGSGSGPVSLAGSRWSPAAAPRNAKRRCAR